MLTKMKDAVFISLPFLTIYRLILTLGPETCPHTPLPSLLYSYGEGTGILIEILLVLETCVSMRLFLVFCSVCTQTSESASECI